MPQTFSEHGIERHRHPMAFALVYLAQRIWHKVDRGG